MKNSKSKRVMSVILLLLILFNVGRPAFAAINTTYGNQTPVDDFAVEEKLKSSSIMEPIALFFYSIASWLEGLIGGVFESLTGTNEFPWADKVIFNTVAFLDVNFLNPAPGSLFLTSEAASEPLKDTPLALIVQKSYSTVMVLCIGFLGVIVGIMAIKLAITTIASEKAKYKQAIVQFATSLVLLFCMHYGISLIFYINEQIVIVASQMLEDNLEESNLQINLELESLNKNEVVEAFIDRNDGLTPSTSGIELFNNFIGKYDEAKEVIRQNVDIAYYFLINQTYNDIRLSKADTSGSFFSLAKDEIVALEHLATDIATIKGDEYSKLKYTDIVRLNNLIVNDAKDEEYINDPTFTLFYNPEPESAIMAFIQSIFGSGKNEEELTQEAIKQMKEGEPLYKILINAHNMYVLKPGDEGYIAPAGQEPQQIITDMATYFKNAAWSFETDEDGNTIGWTASKINYEGAFLYVIFFVQSLAFFIAYIKRFFYVVILALLAPAVILYDFFVKSLAL